MSNEPNYLVTQSSTTASKPRPDAAEDLETPKGTLLITFLFLLTMAVLWGWMYLSLLQIS